MVVEIFGVEILGLGLRVWGLGFRVWGLGFELWDFGFEVWGVGVMGVRVDEKDWKRFKVLGPAR